METLRKNKALGIGVIILIGMNLTLLIFLWLGRNPHRFLPNPKGGEYLEEQLKLSDDQKAKLEILREEHFKRMESLKRKSHEARAALHELWSDSDSKPKVDSLAHEIGQLQSQLEIATFEHFSQIREICTEDQKKTFDKIIDEVLRLGQGQQGPNGRRPPLQGQRENRPPPRRNR